MSAPLSRENRTKYQVGIWRNSSRSMSRMADRGTACQAAASSGGRAACSVLGIWTSCCLSTPSLQDCPASLDRACCTADAAA